MKRAARIDSNQTEIETIYGNIPSKSNCYRFAKGFVYKTKALKHYEDQFYIQCTVYRNKFITGYFELQVKVYYPSQRADLDNALKVICDCLQKAKAIKNDNKCVKIVAEKFLDVKNPRIEYQLTEI